PSFHSGQVFLMSRLGDASNLGLGDVVVLEVDGEPYLKRIRAIGGQTVWGLDSADVDGAPDIMASPFEAEEIRRLARARPGMGRVVNITIPPGHVFVMGDSERNSYDSRQFGAVPVEAIRGRVVVHRLFQLWGPEQSSSAVVRAGDPEKRAGR
ncbi:MAG: signal peptidase I, partial [Armatimonadota bacterium]